MSWILLSVEKFQAMKRYRKRRRLPSSLIFFFMAMVLLLISLLLLSLKWLPYFFSLTHMVSAMVGPKCLFLLCNFIVVFLVTDSKFLRSSSTSVMDDYMEYIVNINYCTKALPDDEDDDTEEEEEEEENSVELNRRSEDLIARVNQQWRLEARSLLLDYHQRCRKGEIC